MKELQLAGASNAEQANAVLERYLPTHHRRFARAARQARDAHRPLGREHDLDAILSLQEERTVSNDYTIRYHNRIYQLQPPVWPGERSGKVVGEQRLDGTRAIRFRERYLSYTEVSPDRGLGGRAPKPPECAALAADARLGETEPPPTGEAVPTGIPPAARVALLQSPILPAARETRARRGSRVQGKSPRGVNRSNGRSDRAMSPDISIVAKLRTFLLCLTHSNDAACSGGKPW